MARSTANTVSTEGFYRDPALKSSTHIVAAYLDYAATKWPGLFVSYSLCAQAMLGISRIPKSNSTEASFVRRNSGRVRKLLQERYGRELEIVPTRGIRATTDDSDTLKTALPKRMLRLDSARRSVVKTASLIDFDNLPATPEMQRWRDWALKDVKDVLKTLQDPKWQRKLLPPPPPQATPLDDESEG